MDVALDRTQRLADAQLTELYEREARRVTGLVFVLTGDRSAAEELTQEAFVRLHQSWRRIKDPERVDAYLRSIACNLARSWLRRKGVATKHARNETPGRAVSAEAVVISNETDRHVLEALHALPERQRECIALRYYADLSPPAIAEALDLSVSSVKTHLRRGLESLRGQIGSEDP